MIKSSERSILYKYARACMYVFREQLKEQTIESFLGILNFLKKNKSVSSESPSFVISLFKLLVSAKRSRLFFSVLNIIFLLWCEEQNIEIVYIYSASVLHEDDQKKIKLYCSAYTKKSNIYILYVVDKKLIAGIRIESKNMVLDYSLKAQLDNVKKLVFEKGIS